MGDLGDDTLGDLGDDAALGDDASDDDTSGDALDGLGDLGEATGNPALAWPKAQAKATARKAQRAIADSFFLCVLVSEKGFSFQFWIFEIIHFQTEEKNNLVSVNYQRLLH